MKLRLVCCGALAFPFLLQGCFSCSTADCAPPRLTISLTPLSDATPIQGDTVEVRGAAVVASCVLGGDVTCASGEVPGFAAQWTAPTLRITSENLPWPDCLEVRVQRDGALVATWFVAIAYTTWRINGEHCEPECLVLNHVTVVDTCSY